jgi:purine-nucleoside phosphorylase
MDSSPASPIDETARLTASDTERYRKQVKEAARHLHQQVGDLPSTAVLTGRTLGLTADVFSVDTSVSYADIPHMPVLQESAEADGTAQGDAAVGRVEVGALAGRSVVALRGRRHGYDGATPREVTFPVRVLGMLGIDTVIVLGGALGLGRNHEGGDLFLVTDHINFQGRNPLVGPNVDAWGPRFPDMSEPYDPALRRGLSQAALDRGIRLHQGTFLAVQGPDRETAAETQMYRTLGADAVGTNLVPEVLVARHMDLRTAALVVLRSVARPTTVRADVEVARRPPEAASATATDLLERLLQTS